METQEQLQLELNKCLQWETEQKDLWFWEKLGRLPFKLLDKLTPKFFQQKLGQLMDEVGSYIQTGGQYLSSEKAVSQYFKGATTTVSTIEAVSVLSLKEMDAATEKMSQSRKNLASIQGATTGIGGIFTLSIDIPVLLGTSLKTLQDIAMCYGYDPRKKEERIYIIKCLQFASSDIVGKKAILDELSRFHEKDRERQIVSELQGWREVVTAYRDNFGWKKLFQIIPIAGIVFGAFINRSTVNSVAETGKMLYRKRRIQERLATVTKAH